MAYDHQRDLLLVRSPRQPRDLLTHHRSHRAAHEREIHDPQIERQPVELGGARIDAVGLPALLPGRHQPLRIVLEMERVGRAEIAPQLAPGAGVGEQLDVLLRADPPVPAALGTDVECLLELLAQVDVPAAVAFLPRVRRDLQPLALRRPRLAFLLKPCHHGHRM
jgi:hypothetical protein